MAIDHCVCNITSYHSLGETQARGHLVLRDSFQSMQVEDLLALGWQFLQIAEKLVGLLAYQQLLGRIIRLTGGGDGVLKQSRLLFEALPDLPTP